MTHSLLPNEHHLGLVTDLYELTMAAGYFVEGMADQVATFELWVRRLPRSRNFLIAAGLEQAVDYLRDFSFSVEQIEYLRRHPSFAHVPDAWFEYLGRIRFDGDLWAVPEGTVVFQGEPLLRVTSSLTVGQIVETFLLTTLTYQMLVASKAARIVAAGQGRGIIDFGSRRAHGPQAGLLAARAGFVGGCVGTSNAEAGRLLAIPTLGTQAHAWIMALGDERHAFRAFSKTFPGATLLIDTYDTVEGVRNALASGASFSAVRLDSGDMAELSKAVRAILDAAGRPEVRIVASGDLNENKIQALVAAGAPIDLFGAGTELVTSHDQPSLSSVYKLVEQETPSGSVGRFKLATGKKSYPYAKQIFRSAGSDGRFTGDLVARDSETHPGEPLLVPVMRKGAIVEPLPSLRDLQERCRHQIERLPMGYASLEPQPAYPVRMSRLLEEEEERLAAEITSSRTPH